MSADPQLLAWVRENRVAARRAVEQAKALRIAAARRDPSAFIEYVVRDELTNAPVVQARHHVDWQRLASAHRRLVVWSHIESGKTSQFAGRLLWELGCNPNKRFAIVSATADQAEKPLRMVREYIERADSPELRDVFPALEPGDLWTTTAIKVKRAVKSKDPSIQAIGYDGSITGARIDGMLVDDVLDFPNTLTPYRRDDLWARLQSSNIMGRLTSDAWMWVVGTAFHPDDALHRFAKLPNWKWMRTPVIDERGELNWPDRWSRDRIDQKRLETVPIEFARQLLCIARDDASSRFEQKWITRCFELGEQRAVRSRYIPPDGVLVVIGVDLAVQEHSAADETVIFVIAVHPNGTREVLAIEAGRWAGPTIIENIYSAFNRFNAHRVVVESNAAQTYILQFAADRYAMPVVPFNTTSKNKMHPEFGIESIAAEMANGKWIFPCLGGKDKELMALEAELLYYDPRTHTGDRLMAMFFAREGARMGEPARAETVTGLGLTRR